MLLLAKWYLSIKLSVLIFTVTWKVNIKYLGVFCFLSYMFDSLTWWIVVFIVSLAVLVKASDYFTEAAEKLGIYFGIPAFIVGVTIVAFGTSLPELVSSIMAVFQGSTEIVAGNVIGSNIANILLVLGIAAIIGKRFTIDHEIELVDLPILVLSSFLLLMMAWDGQITVVEGGILLLGIVMYIFYAVSASQEQGTHSEKKGKREVHRKGEFPLSALLILFASLFFVFLCAKYTIDSVVKISDILNIGKDLIAVIAVALGTSLPELLVTVSAARKGNAEMAVGNVLGSNVFNTFAVMGIPALLSPFSSSGSGLAIPESMVTFALPVMILSTFLYFIMTRDKQLTQWEGWGLLLFYGYFVLATFGLA